jgi:hypothetical protein
LDYSQFGKTAANPIVEAKLYCLVDHKNVILNISASAFVLQVNASNMRAKHVGFGKIKINQ